METVKLTQYNNASVVKLKNRRIRVSSLSDNVNIIEIKKLVNKGESETPHSCHAVISDRIVVTAIKISNEAALALFHTLGNELKRKGLFV